MKFIADLHIHSRFSIATSRQLRPVALHAWALRKGIAVIGTGDFTHPGWLAELEDQLEPAGDGLYQLRPAPKAEADAAVPAACRGEVRFMLSAEINNIYRKNGKTRKVHNLIYARDFATARRLRAALARSGKLASNGRPILKLDSKDLLALIVEHAEHAFLVPAHIWTPHFSVLGAFSDFNSIEDCYEELTPHVFALETGLSSDPPMNRRLSALDRFALVSNSDAHSPAKLGREATLFDTTLSFPAIVAALKQKNGKSFLGTIEFFPQEGKYHYDGHRACNVRLAPAETAKRNGRCPVCGKKVTLGVCHRVDRLADRPPGYTPSDAPPFESLISLDELLAECLGVGPKTKKVAAAYHRLLATFGSELHILRHTPPVYLAGADIPRLAEAVRRMRAREVAVSPGFDGRYGAVSVFNDNE